MRLPVLGSSVTWDTMKTRIYQIAGGFTAGGAGYFYVDPLNDGHIVAVEITMITAPVAAAFAIAELSTQALQQYDINDAQGPIANLLLQVNAGGEPGAGQTSLTGVAIPIKARQRLYLNLVGAGANQSYVSCRVHVAE